MRPHLSRMLAVSLLVAAALVGAQRGDSGKDPAVDPYADQIRDLGQDGFARREAAGRALLMLGEKVLPSLRTAATRDRDLEVRRRCERLIAAILRIASTSRTIGLRLAVIDAGEFKMGSANGEPNRRDDENLHSVRLTRPFLLGVFEVSQHEYQQVIKRNPSWFARTGSGQTSVAGMDTARFPVENISWFDAIDFCNALSKLDGYEPYYKLADVQRSADAIVSANVTVLGGNGYRLPTEAEWEYACRAHTTTPFHFGLRNTGKLANYKSSSLGGYGGPPTWQSLQRTTRVGEYPPNGWGLFDMHGNVEEWCGDWYDKSYYTRAPASDPPGPDAGAHRLTRGGSWLLTEGSCRSASRFWRTPSDRSYSCGFRVARMP